MGKFFAAVVIAALISAPAAAHQKRTDKCGCHHQYGLVHCHPKEKTTKCEAPVKAKVKPKVNPDEQQKRKQKL